MLEKIMNIGGIITNDKMKLAKSSNIEKTFFSSPELVNASIKLQGDEALGYLAGFGKYTEDIKLDTSHIYEYINACGAVQLYDKTDNKNIFYVIRHLKNPVSSFLKAKFKGR